MAQNPNNAAVQPETSPQESLFAVQFETFDFVDECVMQAEINLIEQYFQSQLNDLLKGPST